MILFLFFVSDFYLGFGICYVMIVKEGRGGKSIFFFLVGFIRDWEYSYNGRICMIISMCLGFIYFYLEFGMKVLDVLK